MTPEELLEKVNTSNDCPVCGSHQIEGDPVDNVSVTERWWCCDCGTFFESTYTVVSVKIIDPPD